MPRTSVDIIELRELYDHGLNDNEIANKLKCTKSSVKYWRKKLGLVSKWKKKTLFTEGIINRILTLHKKGYSISHISKDVNINYQTLMKFLKRKGLSTSRSRVKDTKKYKTNIVLKYLQKRGPEFQHNIIKQLEIQSSSFSRIMSYSYNDIERISLKVGARRGSIKYGGTDIFGEHAGSTIWCIKNDPRLIGFLANKIVLDLKSGVERGVLTRRLGPQLGKERVYKIINDIESK